MVQAAREWSEKVSGILVNEMNFVCSRKDPCLFYKKDKYVEIIITLYVDKLLDPSTKQIETRYHFVREYVEDEILKVVYVRTEDNTVDILTKNTDKSTF